MRRRGAPGDFFVRPAAGARAWIDREGGAGVAELPFLARGGGARAHTRAPLLSGRVLHSGVGKLAGNVSGLRRSRASPDRERDPFHRPRAPAALRRSSGSRHAPRRSLAHGAFLQPLRGERVRRAFRVHSPLDRRDLRDLLRGKGRVPGLGSPGRADARPRRRRKGNARARTGDRFPPRPVFSPRSFSPRARYSADSCLT